jgi:GT2 family glycosyltransferase
VYWSERELPLVERCVASLVAQGQSSADLHVLVVDNGSGLTPELPGQVDLQRLPNNRGFAGGYNVGIRAALAAGADFVFLVNSDLIVGPSCLDKMLEAAAAWPQAGILGPLILSESQVGRIESNGQSFSLRTGRHRELGRGLAVEHVDQAPHAVDAVSGCALLARRAVVERVGMLDEALYLYFEDMDWCLRASRAGFQIGVVPQAWVSHRGAGSTQPGWPGKTFYSVRNHLVVAGRNVRGPLTWVLPALVLGYHLAFLLRSRDQRTAAHLAALVSGTFAAWTSRMGPQAGLASSH